MAKSPAPKGKTAQPETAQPETAQPETALTAPAKAGKAKAGAGKTGIAKTGIAKTGKAKKPAVEKTPAEWAHDRLVMYIRHFETQLDAAQEIAMGFAGGEAGVLRIEGIGWFDPDIVTFYGRDEEGLKTQLIQHVSQLSVILRAVPKTQPEDPPRRIGFALQQGGWDGGESGDGSASV